MSIALAFAATVIFVIVALAGLGAFAWGIPAILAWLGIGGAVLSAVFWLPQVVAHFRGVSNNG
jgi:hypothetical protein